MHLTRSLVTAGFAMLTAAVLAPLTAQADESRTLTAQKNCAGTLNGIGGSCLITASNFAPLIGAKVRYYGPEVGGPTKIPDDDGVPNGYGYYIDSWVVLEAADGSTAFGHCLLNIPGGVPPASLGHCQFTGGNRSLREFEADVTVTYAGPNVGEGNSWNWNGNFSVASSDD